MNYDHSPSVPPTDPKETDLDRLRSLRYLRDQLRVQRGYLASLLVDAGASEVIARADDAAWAYTQALAVVSARIQLRLASSLEPPDRSEGKP